jgi:hypothetical protein
MTQEKREEIDKCLIESLIHEEEIIGQARKDLEGITGVMFAWGIGYLAGHKEARRIFMKENARLLKAIDDLAEKLERVGYKKGG